MNKLKSKGQIEDTIAKKVTRFYVNALGIGPRQAKTYIIEDMVIVRLKGKLLPIESKLLEAKRGIELVKNIRQIFHEITTKRLSRIIAKITNHKVVSSHSDISTKTGERMEIFILDANYEDEFKSNFAPGWL